MDKRIEKKESVKRECTTCEFYNHVCMGYGRRTDNGDYTYGMPIEAAIEMFPNGCSDYGISLGAFVELQQKLEK